MRTVRKISIALILLVGVLFAIQSCHNDETINENDRTSINPSEYGFFHNEAINLYYLNENSKMSNVVIPSEIMTIMYNEVSKAYPDRKFDFPVNITEYSTSLFNGNSINIDDFNLIETYENMASYALENNTVSPKTVSFINSIIYDENAYVSDIEYVLDKVNNFKNTKSDLTAREIDELTIFESTLINSSNLWKLKTTTSKYPCYPNQQIIIADAAGASVGGIWGGALLSLLTDHAQNQTANGGCI